MSSYSPVGVHVTLTAQTLDDRFHDPRYAAMRARGPCNRPSSLPSMPIEQWLERAAARRPDHVAIEAPGGRLTYAELLAAAREDARGLDGRVEIPARPGLDFVVRLHACLLAGARAVPVDL